MKPMLMIVQDAREEQMAREVIAENRFLCDVLLLEPKTAVEQIQAYFHDGTGVVLAYGELAEVCKAAEIHPLVSITFRGQDMANLLSEIGRRREESQGGMAVLGPQLLFTQLAPLHGVMDVPVFQHIVSNAETRAQALQRVIEEQADLVVGDARTCRDARAMGLKTIRLSYCKETFRTFLETASQIAETQLRAQRNLQEMNLLLQHSSDAILRLNNEGEIQYANARAEKALGHTMEELYGIRMTELTELTNANVLVRALSLRRPDYSTVLQFGQVSYVSNLSAISFEGEPDGFILSMQEFAAIDDLDERIRQERHRRGFIAHATFERFPSRSPRIRPVLEAAETYAQYDVPILITGEPRLAKTRLAECIHNASLRRKNPFVSVDLSTILPENQFEILFGRPRAMDTGLVSMANRGTLFLLDVQMLAADCQAQLLSILRKGSFQRKDSPEPVPVDIRLICSTFRDLADLMKEEKFTWQLGNTLMGLTLPMPPIRETPEDIPTYLAEYMEIASKRFKKQARFTDEAMAHLCRYPWPANLRDIEYFCMKALMLASEPEIDLAFVQEKLLPELLEGEQTQAPHIVASQEELAIRQALQESGQNRSLAAERLGISRATLWRRMNKYHIAG